MPGPPSDVESNLELTGQDLSLQVSRYLEIAAHDTRDLAQLLGDGLLLTFPNLTLIRNLDREPRYISSSDLKITYEAHEQDRTESLWKARALSHLLLLSDKQRER